jgi:hypothetical protein
LRWRQRCDDGREVDVADDEQIDVASGPHSAPRGRTEHEGDRGPIHQGRERLAQDIGQPDRLGEDAPEFGEYWRVTIRLEIHLPAPNRSLQEPGGGQLAKLPLHGPEPGAGQPCDLAQVVRLVGMPQEQAEHAAASASEQQCRRLGPGATLGTFRSHFEYECTHTANVRQPAPDAVGAQGRRLLAVDLQS